MLPLGALGVGAVSGFPMDEIWHRAFGRRRHVEPDPHAHDPGRQLHGPWRALLVAGVLLTAAPVLWFLPRDTGDVTADITLDRIGTTTFGVEESEAEGAVVTVALTPADAADDLHWFQATSWQGGGLVLEDRIEVEPGVWRSRVRRARAPGRGPHRRLRVGDAIPASRP